MARAAAYDLILMDVQMPVMDGREATRVIRGFAHHARTPIIAMTANAFREDREASLDAGMNEHLVKPVNPAALHAALAHWLEGAGALAVAAPAGPAGALPAVEGLDVAAGLKAANGQPDLYRRVLEIFLRTDDLAPLQTALAAGDAATARRAAHSLKGSAAMIGATALRDAAGALEAQLAAGATPLPEATTLGAEVTAFKSRLAAALAGTAAAAPARAEPPAGPALLAEFSALLEANDMAALALFRTHEAALRAALGPAVAEIARHLDGFAFEEALAALRAARRG
jgi:CheY-like chemotaxis protein